MATLSGVVEDASSNPVQRLVRVYRHDTGAFVAATLSNATTGAWSVTTADTSKHFAIVHDSIGDQNWDKVVLAMHMDDTGLTDAKGSTVTLNGDAARVSDAAAFGGYAAGFDGGGDYLTVPYSASLFDWWTQAYTLEFFLTVDDLASMSYNDGGLKPVAIGNATPGSNTNYWSFGPISDGTLRFYYYNGTPVTITSTATLSASTRTHIALCSDSSGIRLYMGGDRVATGTVSGTPLSSTSPPLTIGQINSRSIDARIDDLRITKGTTSALYTGTTYTVPSSAFLELLAAPTENALILDYLTPA